MQLSRENDPETPLFLWQQFRAGQGAALERLMAAHFRTLFHYGTKFSADEAFIQDCIQDLFLELWDRRHSLPEEVIVKAYLMASLRRRIHRAAQAQKRFVANPPDENLLPFEFELSQEEVLIGSEAARLLSQEIKTLLENLPKRQKEVIYLKFFEDLDREQIGKVMNIHPQSVSNLLQEAYKCLKTNWRAEYLIFFLMIFRA